VRRHRPLPLRLAALSRFGPGADATAARSHNASAAGSVSVGSPELNRQDAKNAKEDKDIRTSGRAYRLFGLRSASLLFSLFFLGVLGVLAVQLLTPSPSSARPPG